MELSAKNNVLQKSELYDFGLDAVVFLGASASIFTVLGALDASLKFIDFHGYSGGARSKQPAWSVMICMLLGSLTCLYQHLFRATRLQTGY